MNRWWIIEAQVEASRKWSIIWRWSSSINSGGVVQKSATVLLPFNEKFLVTNWVTLRPSFWPLQILQSIPEGGCVKEQLLAFGVILELLFLLCLLSHLKPTCQLPLLQCFLLYFKTDCTWWWLAHHSGRRKSCPIALGEILMSAQDSRVSSNSTICDLQIYLFY